MQENAHNFLSVKCKIRTSFARNKCIKMETKDLLSKSFGQFITGYTLSKAILEDYAKVIAKLEGTTEEEITNRVRKRSEELFKQYKEEIQMHIDRGKNTTKVNETN